MNERLFGVETEYALTGLDAKGQPLNRDDVLDCMMRLLREKAPHIPDPTGRGVFLASAARFYIDAPDHPEFTTPECSNPWDVVRYIRAGERILIALAAAVPSRFPQIAEVVVLRSNVDLSGAGTAWGTHESYMHRSDPAALPAQIIPHLVSRIIYTGAGGFDGRRFRRIEFTLSPRVPHLEHVVSGESTHARGIFHTKDESLSSSGYHRLHILCGETLCSETGAWLKIGATALVVALIEAGRRPGDAVELQSPLSAMRAFASDPSGGAQAKTNGGGSRSAIELQRHYLELAEANVGAPFMPPWAGAVCEKWRAVLDRLENVPESMATVLDWRIKLALFQRRAARRGIAWESLPHWNHIVTKLAEALEREGIPGITPVEQVLDPHGPAAADVRRLTPYARQHGLQWESLRAFVELRQELFEVDLRYGQLGGKGIFDALDHGGVLAHRVEGIDDIEAAMEQPPAVGRAAVRGRFVRELSGNGLRYTCDWNGVFDSEGRRMLDLQDPFATSAQWQPWVAGMTAPRRRLTSALPV